MCFVKDSEEVLTRKANKVLGGQRNKNRGGMAQILLQREVHKQDESKL